MILAQCEKCPLSWSARLRVAVAQPTIARSAVKEPPVLQILKFFEPEHERFDTLIAAGTVVHGKITFTGDLRVDGVVRGDLEVWQSTSGTLVVGKEGRVEGNVEATNVVVNGTVNGLVRATDIVGLGKTAHVTGDIHYGRMVARGAATVKGKVRPLASAEASRAEVRRLDTYAQANSG